MLHIINQGMSNFQIPSMNLHQVVVGLPVTLTRCTTGLSLKRCGSSLLCLRLGMAGLSSACLTFLVADQKM